MDRAQIANKRRVPIFGVFFLVFYSRVWGIVERIPHSVFFFFVGVLNLFSVICVVYPPPPFDSGTFSFHTKDSEWLFFFLRKSGGFFSLVTLSILQGKVTHTEREKKPRRNNEGETFQLPTEKKHNREESECALRIRHCTFYLHSYNND